MFACQHRMVQVMEALRQQYDSTTLVALFSHSDPLKMLVAHYLGMPLDHFQRLTISPGSVTVLHVTDDAGRLVMMNVSPDFSWDEFQPPKPKKPRPPRTPPSTA